MESYRITEFRQGISKDNARSDRLLYFETETARSKIGNRNGTIIPISARTGVGIHEWSQMLNNQVKA